MGLYGCQQNNYAKILQTKAMNNIVRDAPRVVVFRALTSTGQPERGELVEGIVMGSERYSLLVDVGDGLRRRISRTVSASHR